VLSCFLAHVNFSTFCTMLNLCFLMLFNSLVYLTLFNTGEGEGIICPSLFFLLTFKQKITLPWFNLTMPKNALCNQKWGILGNQK